MNQYFHHLIERSSIASPAIHPRLPAFFESPDDRPIEPANNDAAESVSRPQGKGVIDANLTARREETSETDRKSLRPETRPQQVIGHIAENRILPQKQDRENTSLRRDRKDEDEFLRDAAHHPPRSDSTAASVNRTNIRYDTSATSAEKTGLTGGQIDRVAHEHRTHVIPESGPHPPKDAPASTAGKPEALAVRHLPADRLPGQHALPVNSFLRPIDPTFASKQPVLYPSIPQSITAPQPAPEKTIRITIGRVDVRAIMSPPPSPSPRTSPRDTPPKITLEEYLKKQRGGSK